ncbi:PAS domain S-box protein [Gemmatimonadota bacterium]
MPDLRHPLPSLDSFERLVRSGPAVLYTAAPRDAFHFTYLSPNIEDLTGFGTDRLLGDSGFWLSRIHPDDLPLVEEEARQAGEAGYHAVEYRYRTNGGNYLWLWDEGRPRIGESGDQAEITGFLLDITPQKSIQQALAQQTELYQAVLRTAMDVFYLVDTNGVILEVNPAFCEMAGRDRDELIGRHVVEVGFPGTKQDIERRIEDITEHGHLAYEREFVRPDGQIRYLELSVNAIDWFGRPVLVAFAHDITRRRKAAEMLARSQAHLAVAQHIANMGSWEWYREDDRMEWSDQVYRMFGVDRDAFAGTMESFVRFLHPEEVDQVIDQFTTKVKGRSEDFEVQFRVVRPDGEARNVVVEGRPERRDDGYLVRITGTVRDITEELRTQERLMRAEKYQSLATMAAGVAHDFNNLLTGILGNAEVAQQHLPRDGEAWHKLESIKKASHVASNLSGQMVAYAGGGSFRVGRFDLAKLVGTWKGELSGLAPGNIRIEFNIEPGEHPVRTDVQQVHRLIFNLVENAIESIADGPGIVRLSVGTLLADPQELAEYLSDTDLDPGFFTYVEVSDTGEGMDEETRRRMFEPFFTTRFAGRGLGLAAVYGIVQNDGGGIRVQSEPDTGTSIRVLLPLATDDAGKRDAGGKQT